MGLLERNLLKLLDGDNVLPPNTIRFITPKEVKTEKTIISQEQPFIYLIKGPLINEGPHTRLKLRTVEYLLQPGKEYSIVLQRGDNRSNQVSFKI